MLQVEIASPFYPAPNGTPLQLGSIWYGVAGQNPVTHPVTVYWDDAGTQPAKQPISVMNGRPMRNGAPARVYVSGDYSKLVQDSLGRQVLWEPTQNSLNLFSLPISVKAFHAKGDGVTDDTAAFNAAFAVLSGGGALYVSAGTYLITSSLAWPANVLIYGDGRAVSIIKKGFNGDLFSSVGQYAEGRDLRLDGDGGNFTGRVLYVSTQPSPCQTFERCDIIKGQTNSVEFVANAGASSRFESCDIYAYDLTKPAIQFPDDAAGGYAGLNRRFISINTGGGILADMNGADDTYIVDSFFRGLNFSKPAGCGILWCTGNRFATLGASQTFNGGGMVIVNNNFAGAVIITPNSTGVTYGNNAAASVTWQPAANTYGSVTFPKQPFACAWSQGAGAQPALGNGTLQMEYSRQGMNCTVTMCFVFGSTSTPGDGSSAWRFSLPYRASQAVSQQSALVGVQDATGAVYPMNLSIGNGEAYFLLGAAQSVRAGYPFAWATGAAIKTTFTYAVDG